MKKIALFVFAIGVGMSALASDECNLACEDAYDACIAAGTNAKGCVYRWEKCLDLCNI